MQDAGVTKVECPDPSTMVITTDDPSDRALQISLPIIPKHIWGKETYKTIGKAKFDGAARRHGPVHGRSSGRPASSSASSATRTTGGRRRSRTKSTSSSTRTPTRWSRRSRPVTSTTRTVPTPSSSTSSRPTRTSRPWPAAPTAGPSWRSTSTAPSTGKTIPGGGPSTKALLDPAFRDALGYAVDHQALVDRVLGGYGDVGTTIVPPVLTQWHVEPTNLRKFDIELAKQKLDAAGYTLDANGKRLDKEGKPINLRMFMPDSDANYPKAAQFIADWYGQLGIKVTTQVESSAVLGERILPPEAGDKKYKADYDIELWGWSGGDRPQRPAPGLPLRGDRDLVGQPVLQPVVRPDVRRPAEGADGRGPQGDPQPDAEHDLRRRPSTTSSTTTRTPRPIGPTGSPVGPKQPESNGTPFFTYSTLDYTKLTDAKAVPTPAPSEAVASVAPGASGAPSPAPRSRVPRRAPRRRTPEATPDPRPRSSRARSRSSRWSSSGWCGSAVGAAPPRPRTRTSDRVGPPSAGRRPRPSPRSR